MPFFGSLGTIEWVIIGLVVVLLFGGKKLTELARGLGESGKELKRVKREFKAAVDDDAAPPSEPKKESKEKGE